MAMHWRSRRLAYKRYRETPARMGAGELGASYNFECMNEKCSCAVCCVGARQQCRRPETSPGRPCQCEPLPQYPSIVTICIMHSRHDEDDRPYRPVSDVTKWIVKLNKDVNEVAAAAVMCPPEAQVDAACVAHCVHEVPTPSTPK